MDDSECFYDGGCTCGQVRYRMQSAPMFVHCCHCSWCQRETGSAFVINAMIEADRVVLLKGKPVVVLTPSASGRGQKIARCPRCQVAVWSNYSSESIRFVRVGTLDDPGRVPPDIHIFTSTKQPWFNLPDNIPVCTEYYAIAETWPEEAYQRFRTLFPTK